MTIYVQSKWDEIHPNLRWCGVMTLLCEVCGPEYSCKISAGDKISWSFHTFWSESPKQGHLSDSCLLAFCYFLFREATEADRRSVYVAARAGGAGGEGGCVGVCPYCVSLLGGWALPHRSSVSGWMSYASVMGAWLDCFKRPGLCATTTKQGSRLCLGAGTAQRGCLDSECHRLLYSRLECRVSSPIWVVRSVRTLTISLCDLTGEMFADPTLFFPLPIV